MNDTVDHIFSLRKNEFEKEALKLFHFQSKENEVYRNYLDHLKINPEKIALLHEIPHLPISFFKYHPVKTGTFANDIIFTSSGTTGMQRSLHYVKNLAIYENSFLQGFNHFYGEPQQYCMLAILPSYLEREGSSLVYMMQKLIENSGHRRSGFYLYDYERLAQTLAEMEKISQPVILMGVTFALLDFVEKFPMKLKNTIIMETGGMKGMRKEMIREELHAVLKKGFGVEHIHSEYGMTELLSQAYSKGNGVFNTPPWMQVNIRDLYDPFSQMPDERSGAVNIIDLANRDSCAFIETNDLGRKFPDGSFELLGRADNSDIRGCNLLL